MKSFGMQPREFRLTYEEYASDAELEPADRDLLAKAGATTVNAYAPYSLFRVGAAARLSNGAVITGTNQENASFPAGICAERTLLSAIASLHPGESIESMAISYDYENGLSDQPISPCGICRQSLQEFIRRTGRDIRLILGGKQGPVVVLPRASALLPLAFTGESLG
jgi:cytidine deaminase